MSRGGLRCARLGVGGLRKGGMPLLGRVGGSDAQGRVGERQGREGLD